MSIYLQRIVWIIKKQIYSKTFCHPTPHDKNIDLKMQSAVLARLGIDVFNVLPQHYFDHRIGEETDHLSSLLKRVVSKYIQMRLKTYGKKYTAEIAHGNKVSKRHQLTKLILFSNR